MMIWSSRNNIAHVITILWGPLSAINSAAHEARGGKNGQSVSTEDLQGDITCRGHAGSSESKWELGVFQTILVNDLYYEASEIFSRAFKSTMVGAVLKLRQNNT